MFEFKSTIHGLFLPTHFYLINNPGYLNINFPRLLYKYENQNLQVISSKF